MLCLCCTTTDLPQRLVRSGLHHLLPPFVPLVNHERLPRQAAQGCALVFPHGDSRGSLLHEGSPVGHGGAKYVIRTEVLYDAYDAVPEGVVGGKEGEVDEGITA